MKMELDRAVEQSNNNSYRNGDPWPEVRPTSRCGSQSEVVECIDNQISRCNNINIDDPNAGSSDVSQNLEFSISNENHYDKVIPMAREVANDGQAKEVLLSPGRRNSVLTDSIEKMISASVSATNGLDNVVDGIESNIFGNIGGTDNENSTINVEADGIRKLASVTKLVEDFQIDSEGRCRDFGLKSDVNSYLDYNPLQNGDLKLSKTTDFIEKDETAALWVKCRGKWEAGIKCSRADWPLSILNSKPAHCRKKHCVVFFPNRKTHSWVDILLVRTIDESPEPLACGTHCSSLESVKDLNSARRYIMREIVIQMLNVTDRLHQRAVTENARHASTWKDFAWKGFHCELYCNLGNMLVVLQQMLLPGFVDSDWLQVSFIHWVELCKNAETAESVEVLLKELVESIMWDQVEELWNTPTEADSDNEWKSWKQEVIEWLSSRPHQAITELSFERHNFDVSSASASPQVSRKRQKLEIRRADTRISEVETETYQADADDGVFSCLPVRNTVAAIEAEKDEHIIDDLNDGEGWVEIVIEEAGYSVFSENIADIDPSVNVKASLRNMEGRRKSHTVNKYRHCMAFMEAKGRQCGRWANDGDIYCPAHLRCHNAEKAGKVEQMPPTYSNLMCEGRTNLGGKCKHRARFGSLYCKKHRPDKNEARKGDPFFPPHNLTRKLSDAKGLVENISSQVLKTGKEISFANCRNELEYHYNAVFESEDMKNLVLSQTVNLDPTVSNDLHGEAGNCSRCISECSETAKLHTLYCEKHRPNFLKRARNGKTRLISKEHFVDLLKNCGCQNQKVQIHQACELLYGFMKSALSRRNHVSKDQLMEWIVSEASKDFNIGEYLLKIVTLEREKNGRILGLEVEKVSMNSMPCLKSMPHFPKRDGKPGPFPAVIKCKICAQNFFDDQALGGHWMDVHRKEAQWLFRGYACAMCMTSFTNRKVLETHAKEKHNVQSVDEYVLFQCMPCGDNFKNPEQLWVHVLSFHSKDFRLPSGSEKQDHAPPVLGSQTHPTLGHDLSGIQDTHVESKEEPQKFFCKFCGLKFDLLPDLGRHHQAAHTAANATNHFRPNRQVHFISAPRRRPGRPRKYFRDVDSVTQEENNFDLSYFPDSDSMTTSGLRLLTQISQATVDERLIESQCSSVAQILSDEIQRTKYHPSNLEILSVAQLTCCKSGLQSVLAKKFGPMSDRVYLKAARLCSELNFRIEWHREGFICPRGCQESRDPNALISLSSLPDLDEVLTMNRVCKSTGDMSGMEESHFVVNYQDLRQRIQPKTTVLCEDISFGRERIPVPCVVDDHLRSSLELRAESLYMPWKNFTYITDRMLSLSLGMNMKSSQLGCACHPPNCCPETCDHVYLFNNDCEGAKDIHGGTLHGRFPYDDMGRLILEGGYLVYECNSMCSCDKTCLNRVLQNGLHVRLEIFMTENKGWAVRTYERIARGTFVCEFMGEVLNDQETNERGSRHANAGNCFIYDIDAHIDVTSRMNEGSNPYIIDATHYGNVSRFINHSCSPNLVNYQVLVESMDCQLAHIGFYASRDIDEGEELLYDYRYKLLPGDGFPCYCGASNCRGRLL